MALTPEAFFKFGLHHYGLLLNLFWHEGEVSEGVIYDYILQERRRTDNSSPGSKPDYIFKQLIGLKFIQPLPEANAYYELSSLTKDIIRKIEHEYRFTSAEQIQHNIDEIESFYHLLQTSFHNGSRGVILSQLRDLVDLIERLDNSANGNRLAIIKEVKEVRLNACKESTSHRYDVIYDINARYIEPLRDSIQIGKPMDRKLEMCQDLLTHAAEKYMLEKDIALKINRVLHKLPSLRKSMLLAFEESIDEITPILEKLRDNIFSRGATIILEDVAKKGHRVLDLVVEELSLPSTKMKTGHFDDEKILEFIMDASQYKPVPPPTIDHTYENFEPKILFDYQNAIHDLRKGLPVEDLFLWIQERYGTEPLKTALILQNKIFNIMDSHCYGKKRSVYQFATGSVEAYPLSILTLE